MEINEKVFWELKSDNSDKKNWYYFLRIYFFCVYDT